MKIKLIFQFTLIVFTVSSCSNTSEEYNEIYQHILEKDFFQADSLFNLNKKDLGKINQKVLQAKIDNAFNQNERSQSNIKYILEQSSNLPDSTIIDLYKTKIDNEFKLYEYNSAKESLKKLLENYKRHFNKEELEDLKNDLNMYSALETIPFQKINKTKELHIQMTKDIAGLNNLPVHTKKDSSQFIFDTGANLSVVSETTSQKLGIEILLNSTINVNALTGGSVKARLGWAREINIENITLNNVVFLVFKNADLAFPSINYQINGILGYPVIAALGEIQIGKEGVFKVPKVTPTNSKDRNLALDILTPITKVDDLLYTFDTGAASTMLYPVYYQLNKASIEKKYIKESIQLGGAGGVINYQGFHFPHTIDAFDKKITLETILLIDMKQKHHRIMGNLGQDYLGQFGTMILNFRSMHISLQ
ncbi:retropepsin-like aspartic protease [Ulvibacter litoralis]|uniref:Aspartyl protease n=1 Tax=Ulvibacter litoralis TaxID=227084 RepID=A0A1G7IHI8_9FLAO|nr:retropepsin-like aspartic protease [Ulvibacter litoralis]GHC60819.1 hypothetical protein GCM10008083_27310 [Ulvibacter litoralis]SDF12048.1 Aspartyl protease [Ulvibacter litoralis]